MGSPVTPVLVCLVVLLAGCATGSVRPESQGPTTIHVPRDAPTIQQAVDAAHPGDLVLVAPGVYRETVRVGRADVVVRGEARAGVVIDGELRRTNGVVVTAPGVVVENLTVRNHLLNGVLVTGLSDSSGGLARGSAGYQRLDPAKHPALQGFRVSYVTASNNGLYGIYAFNARHGLIEHSYASGSADSGIYVGQCKPCAIVVRDNVAERNAVGFEGANASGEMFVLANRLTGNRVGLTFNSDYQEAFVPQEDAVIAGNLVAGNAEPVSPAQADGAFGLGVGMAGAVRNLLLRNRISGNGTAGVALGSAEDLPPVDNRIEGNVITDNAVAVAYTATERAPGRGNCLRGNDIDAGPNPSAECLHGAGTPLPRQTAPPGVAFHQIPAPPAQPELPEAGSAPARPARGLPGEPDLAAATVPGPDLLVERAAVRP